MEVEMASLLAAKTAEVAALSVSHTEALQTQRVVLEAVHREEMGTMAKRIAALEESVSVKTREHAAMEEVRE
jgi:glycine cleavage system pyridoxal-binding protein P